MSSRHNDRCSGTGPIVLHNRSPLCFSSMRHGHCKFRASSRGRHSVPFYILLEVPLADRLIQLLRLHTWPLWEMMHVDGYRGSPFRGSELSLFRFRFGVSLDVLCAGAEVRRCCHWQVTSAAGCRLGVHELDEINFDFAFILNFATHIKSRNHTRFPSKGHCNSPKEWFKWFHKWRWNWRWNKWHRRRRKCTEFESVDI